jgi:hypothetical protein
MDWELLTPYIPLLIPVTAIIGAFTFAIMRSEHKTRIALAQPPDGRLNRMAEENLAINRQIYARLEMIEQRLTGVEKMLKEIPQ